MLVPTAEELGFPVKRIGAQVHLPGQSWHKLPGRSDAILEYKSEQTLKRTHGQEDVIADGLHGQQSFGLTVLGDESHFQADRLRGAFNTPDLPVDLQRARSEWSYAE